MKPKKKGENGIHQSRNANLGRSKAPEATILKAAQKWYKKKEAPGTRTEKMRLLYKVYYTKPAVKTIKRSSRPKGKHTHTKHLFRITRIPLFR